MSKNLLSRVWKIGNSTISAPKFPWPFFKYAICSIASDSSEGSSLTSFTPANLFLRPRIKALCQTIFCKSWPWSLLKRPEVPIIMNSSWSVSYMAVISGSEIINSLCNWSSNLSYFYFLKSVEWSLGGTGPTIRVCGKFIVAIYSVSASLQKACSWGVFACFLCLAIWARILFSSISFPGTVCSIFRQ